jgi:phytanoyl-CoA hydroxylase
MGFTLDIPEGRLAVNDGPLLSENVNLLRPSDPTLPVEELRKRFNEDGYLFVKHLLPREHVLKARERYFDMLVPTGLLKGGTKSVEGVFNDQRSPDDFPGIGAGGAGMNGRPGGESAAQFVDLALKAHYRDWYTEEFCRHLALKDFIAKFTGWHENTLGLRRSLLRNNVPGTKPIGVHYDQIFLRHGEPTSITAWVPMGDISLVGGGLIYLENGSYGTVPTIYRHCQTYLLTQREWTGDPIGQQMEADFTKQAKKSGLSDEEAKNAFNSNMMSTGLLSEYPAEFAKRYSRRWLIAEYEAGDVVLHKPHAVSFTICFGLVKDYPPNF